MNTTDIAVRTDLRKKLILAAVGCMLFIAYGSMVPLAFSPQPMSAAWHEFLAAPYHPFGIESRTDWIANIVLYVPPACLLSAGFADSQGSLPTRALAAGAAFLTCAAVALGVEFAQLYFPPRTASLSDVVGNCIGAGIGIAVWSVWGEDLVRLLADTKRGGPVAVRAAMVLYVLAYLTLSLFPFDFLLAASELSQKIASDRYGLLVAPVGCGRFAGCTGKLAVEIVAVVPLGILLGIMRGQAAGRVYSTAVWSGLALGIVVEVTQFFIASGVSQGGSLLTRAAGLVLGVALHRHARRRWLLALQPYVVPALILAGAPYLLGLMWVNRWFGASWVGLAEALSSLELMHWPPFYYHYYASESSALVSVLACIAMYSPVGIGFALAQFAPPLRKANGSTLTAAVVAATLAAIMEAGKLFARAPHPDPTNILIGAVAAAVSYRLARHFIEEPWSEHAPAPRAMPSENVKPRLPATHGSRRYAMAAVAFLLAGFAAYRYPLPGPWLLFALAGYGYLIWRFPSATVPAVVASLPLSNLAQWTGWFAADEFDLVMLVTVGVSLCRPVATGRNGWPPALGLVGALVALSFLISAGLGLLPLQPWDANALSSYYSHYNALRVAKGALWAFCLLRLAASERDTDLHRRFTLGMVAGLAGTLAVIVWERLAFTGLFNFSHDHRVSGPFSALHIGGSSLECYLVTALPFLGFALLTTRHWAWRVGGLLLAGAGVYGVMVTYSRAGLAALAVVGALMCVAFVRHGRQRAWGRRAYVALGLLVVAGMAAVAVPLLKGSFAQERLAQSERDLATRFSYWRNALAIMDEGWRTRLFGMGLGRFPETFFWQSTVGTRPATYRFESENGNVFLRLGSGGSLYLNQIVALKPHHRYTLALDARSNARQGAREVGVPICEKRVRQSFRCADLQFELTSVTDAWQHHEIAFDSDAVGAGPWYSRRPVVLSLHNSTGIVDVDNVRLLGEGGHDLLANGDFAAGGERWWFSVDDNWPWHIENFWLHVYFEQGLLGLLAIAALTVCALAVSLRRMWGGDPFAGSLLASIAGFLVVGTLNSPNDNPQLLLLFLLLCGLACLARRPADREYAGNASEGSQPLRRPVRAAPGAVSP